MLACTSIAGMQRKYAKGFKRGLILISSSGFLVSFLFLVSGCSHSALHHGRLPFSWMEKAPDPPERMESQRMRIVMHHDNSTVDLTIAERSALRPGDVIAFHMSHHESWEFLKKDMIQKIPYDLFQYGHLAIVVPSADSSGVCLLQVAMKQAVNDEEGLDYLGNPGWCTGHQAAPLMMKNCWNSPGSS